MGEILEDTGDRSLFLDTGDRSLYWSLLTEKISHILFLGETIYAALQLTGTHRIIVEGLLQIRRQGIRVIACPSVSRAHIMWRPEHPQ